MSKNTTAVELLMTFILLAFIMVIDEADGNGGGGLKLFGNQHLPKIRHARGKYSTKEEVMKKIEHDHPCKLTQTAVKITFPGMKEDVLVSFLGYKEPNLMPVQRCKGLCGDAALSPVACVPTKLRYKKVKMQIKTQYLGHDAQERFRELVLEEHEECGCRCLNVRPEHCMEPSLFNNETCSCQCDTSLYNRDQIRCETMDDRTWDPVTCTCRRIEEALLVGGPKQTELDARKAAEAAGELPPSVSLGGGHFHGRHHHHKKQTRPGHDVEPEIIVGCVGEDCEECDDPSHYVEKSDVAVMPKSTSDSMTNGWTAIAICTFLVVVFATTTVYYWQKAKKMAKEKIDDDNDVAGGGTSSASVGGVEDIDNGDIEVLSAKTGKKMSSSCANSIANGDLSPCKELLNSQPIKSPVELVKKLCDKKMNHVAAVTATLPTSPLLTSSQSPVIDYQKTNGGQIVANSTSCVNLKDIEASNEDEETSSMGDPVAALPVPSSEMNGGSKNIMELLLAAAAKRDKKGSSGNHRTTTARTRAMQQRQKMAKAASMSELEASQLEPPPPSMPQQEASMQDTDQHHLHHHHHHHHNHHHHRNHHQSKHHRSTSSNADMLHVAVQHRSSHEDDLDVIEVDRDYGDCCNDHQRHLLRSATMTSATTITQRGSRPPRGGTGRCNAADYHHGPPPSHMMTLDSRYRRGRHRHYHGSFGHLLDDEDLLQQCLATLVMDAAILRQQQQLQQEQLKLQQEQLAQQANVIEQQAKLKSSKKRAAEVVDVALTPVTGTDTQSVIESIAGDAPTTIVTVDRLQVSVEVEDPLNNGKSSDLEESLADC